MCDATGANAKVGESLKAARLLQHPCANPSSNPNLKRKAHHSFAHLSFSQAQGYLILTRNARKPEHHCQQNIANAGVVLSSISATALLLLPATPNHYTIKKNDPNHERLLPRIVQNQPWRPHGAWRKSAETPARNCK